ncbi:MAG: protein TolQ [Deltaproteobacteria bacterium]|nr:protein TolQ [Deltaproteobacteria bacterium]
MISTAGPMVKLVLLILLLLSVISWAVILYKVSLIRKVEKESSAFYEVFWKNRDFTQILAVTKNYPLTPLSRIFKNIYAELAPSVDEATETNSLHIETDYLKRIIKKTITQENIALERGASFLATTGNTAPFIGLFGTVWGIMNSFRAIGLEGGANLAVVAPGISEALVATAMGLFAAIPAVVGYNSIIARTERINSEMESFSSDLLNIIEKQLRINTEEETGDTKETILNLPTPDEEAIS